MIPVVTPDEMRRIDERAMSSGVSLDTLVNRAGWAVARAARQMLGGTYGRRVVVVAGPGNNGADGRVAARLLAERGVWVRVIEVGELPTHLPEVDLLVDAAFGTGFHGEWNPPPAPCRVLAVDLPSGVDGLTGRAHGSPWQCARTITFAAAKPGHFFHEGRRLSGTIEVADIGLDVSSSTIGVMTDDDIAARWPTRRADAHKWTHGAYVVAGSPGMTGAASLTTEAALRAGAGIVHLASPGVGEVSTSPIEVVRRPIGAESWGHEVLADVSRRFRVLAIGPGLGRADHTMNDIRRVVASADLPIVVDGDALHALDARSVSARSAPTIITPHDGEFATLAGEPPGDDRVDAARDLARRFGAVVLSKGPTTVIADPSGEVVLVDHGDDRLATAGSGDVLTGVVTGAVAAGASPMDAAGMAAWVCAEAGRRCHRHGTIASDILAAVPLVLDDLLGVPLDRAE